MYTDLAITWSTKIYLSISVSQSGCHLTLIIQIEKPNSQVRLTVTSFEGKQMFMIAGSVGLVWASNLRTSHINYVVCT